MSDVYIIIIMIRMILSRWRACSREGGPQPLMRQLTNPCDLIGREPALPLLPLVGAR